MQTYNDPAMSQPNTNEELNKILNTCDFEPEGFNSRVCLYCGERKSELSHTSKQKVLDWHKAQLTALLEQIAKLEVGQVESTDPLILYWQGYHQAQVDISNIVQHLGEEKA